MKNSKSIFFFGLFLGSFAFFLAKQPIAFAANDCAYNVADPSTCCVAGQTGYNGVYCDPGQYIQKIGSGSPICKSSADILQRLVTVNTKLFAGFNCFNDLLNKSCQNPATQCYNAATDACQVYGGPNAICTGLSKKTNCDSSCGACFDDKILCGGLCKTPLTAVCGTGYKVDPCTGTCSCPEGLTPSGVISGVCISFFERFREIMDFGLAPLGGLKLSFGGLTDVMSYAYGSIGKDADWSKPTSDKAFYGKIFVEADQADHLNWSSPSVPAIFQNMIVGAGYQFCNASYACPTDQICTAGICNKPGGTVGIACANSSACRLGLACTNGICTNPNATLTACTSNSQCSLPQTCVLGFCRNQGNGLGASCLSGNDSECAAGLICNASKICVLTSDTTSRFVGLTPTTYTGNQANYQTTDLRCNSAYAGSHVCWSKEIVASYLANVPTLTGVTDTAWINAAAPGNISPAINDCGGWTKNVNPYYGTVWNFVNKASGIQPCFATKKFSCCK